MKECSEGRTEEKWLYKNIPVKKVRMLPETLSQDDEMLEYLVCLKIRAGLLGTNLGTN